jgi:hypothetical protein
MLENWFQERDPARLALFCRAAGHHAAGI